MAALTIASVQPRPPRKARGNPYTEEWFWYRASPCPITGCWWWMSTINKGGYGTATMNGKTENAHRVTYRFFRGLIPKGLDLDHLCRMRSCVNPWHLEPVTRSENLRRGNSGDNLIAAAAAITICPKGHPYSGSNLYDRPDGGRKGRDCIKCQRQRVRDWRARQKLTCEGIAP